MSVTKYNNTADSNTSVGDGVGAVGIQEGMPRRDVNNAMRAIASDIAKDYADQGAITSAGSSNAITLATNSDITSFKDGIRFTFKAHASPSWGATLNVNNVGALPLKAFENGVLSDVSALSFSAGQFVQAIYDGGNWVCLTSGSGGEFYPNLSAMLAETRTLKVGAIVYARSVAFNVVAASPTYGFVGASNNFKPSGVERIARPIATGGTAPVTENTFWDDRAAIRVGGSDPNVTNDERGYVTAGLNEIGLGTNVWGTAGLQGLYSTAWHRNGLSYAAYSDTTGHDCGTFGTASSAGGVGSVAGNPWDPDNALGQYLAYCAFVRGKNNILTAPKGAMFGEEGIGHGRAAFLAGYAPRTGVREVIDGVTGAWTVSTAGIAPIALGYRPEAIGDGAVAAGKNVKATNGQALGQGINDGSPMAVADTVGLGWNVAKPTISVEAGRGGVNDVCNVVLRSAESLTARGIEFVDISNVMRASIKTVLSSVDQSGSYDRLQLDTRMSGSIVRGFDVDGSTGDMSLTPATANTHRVGSASKPLAYGWIQNAWIVTSDARAKSKPKMIDKRALAAWADVDRVQYQLLNKDGKAEGDQNVGVIAQDIIATFKKHGLDALDWAIVVEGDNSRKDQDDAPLGINYTQCETFEAAFLRQQIVALSARVELLEAALKTQGRLNRRP